MPLDSSADDTAEVDDRLAVQDQLLLGLLHSDSLLTSLPGKDT